MQEDSEVAPPQLYCYRTLQKVKVLECPAAEADAIQPVTLAASRMTLRDNSRRQSVMESGGYLFHLEASGGFVGECANGDAEVDDQRISVLDVEGIRRPGIDGDLPVARVAAVSSAIAACPSNVTSEAMPTTEATASKSLPQEDVSTVWICLVSIASTSSTCFSLTPGETCQGVRDLLSPKESRR